MTARNEFSYAHPKRLFESRDEGGIRFHELAGARLERGTMLMLQLVDGTWLRGIYDWDQPASDYSYDASKPPILRVLLAEPAPASAGSGVEVSFYLPPDAFLRVDPRWKYLMNPRPPRNRQPRGKP